MDDDVVSQTRIDVKDAGVVITSFKHDAMLVVVNVKSSCFMLHLNKEDFKKLAYELNELRFGLP